MHPRQAELSPEFQGEVCLAAARSANNDDAAHDPFRLIEPLLYRSRYYDTSMQSMMLSEVKGDDRPFVLSTPRLDKGDSVELPIPFASELVDKLFRMKRERYAWVAMAPAAWLLACTLTAGWQKIFSADPKVGFLSHAARYADALAEGRLLAPAKTSETMARIVFNDRLDAALCGLFIFVVLSVLFYSVKASLAARASNRPTTPAMCSPRRI